MNKNELPIIDLKLGAEILNSDIEAARKMINALVKQLPEDLQKLKTAFCERDNAQLKDLAHYINGGASYCGTPRLKSAAAELEKIMGVNNSSEKIQLAYENLCHEIELILAEYSHRA